MATRSTHETASCILAAWSGDARGREAGVRADLATLDASTSVAVGDVFRDVERRRDLIAGLSRAKRDGAAATAAVVQVATSVHWARTAADARTIDGLLPGLAVP